MAILTIEGRKVTVDDSFRNLSPEQQAATVEEIAAQIGIKPQQPQVASNAAAKADALPAPQQFSDFDSAVLGAANGLLQNFGAEAAGVVGGIVEGLGREEGFNAARKRTAAQAQSMLDRASAENPLAFGGGEIGGSIATAIAPGAAALKGATTAAKVGKLAGVGAAQGAVFGAGEDGDLAQRANEAGKGAFAGGLFGAAGVPTGRLIGSISRRLTGKNKLPEVPESEELRALSQQFYQEAANSGVVVGAEKVGRIVNMLRLTARKAGARPGLTPQIDTALNALEKEALNPQSLGDLDLMRQVLKIPAGDANPNVRRLAGELSERFDDLLDGLKPQDLAPGSADPRLGLEALRDARQLWRRMRKNEMIEQAFDKAKDNAASNFSQSGIENAIRKQLKQIKQNRKKFRQFDDDEKRAIIAAIRPAKKERFYRHVGKLAPRGVVSAAVSIGGGSALGGPVGAMALPAVGSLAANAADRIAREGVESLAARVRLGEALPVFDDTAQQLLATRGLTGAGRTLTSGQPASRQR